MTVAATRMTYTPAEAKTGKRMAVSMGTFRLSGAVFAGDLREFAVAYSQRRPGAVELDDQEVVRSLHGAADVAVDEWWFGHGGAPRCGRYASRRVMGGSAGCLLAASRILFSARSAVLIVACSAVDLTLTVTRLNATGSTR